MAMVSSAGSWRKGTMPVRGRESKESTASYASFGNKTVGRDGKLSKKENQNVDICFSIVPSKSLLKCEERRSCFDTHENDPKDHRPRRQEW
jgi:hypothetical protein